MWKKVVAFVTLFRHDARVLWHALRHPDAPRWLKPAVGALVLYAISPIDLIPDVVAVFGLADDVILIPLAVRQIIKRLPEHVRRSAESRVGATTVRAR
jgi:uncharacterized membrane protein YkvA (DUF1232 family)